MTAPVFLTATLIGTFAWNAPLLTLGYLLRGTSADPAALGLLLVGGVVLSELALFLVLRRLRPPVAEPTREAAAHA